VSGRWLTGALALGLSTAILANEPSSPLVDVQSRLPDLALDMRYAGSNNFVGQPIDGYLAPRCLLLPEVAAALVAVEQALRAEGLRLVIYDCYRPRRAVAHFMRWARDLADQSTKAAFYPRLDKAALVPEYIAEHSGHSRGDTVDVGLLRCAVDACEALDMGTAFDLFDLRANTESPEITDAQRAHRQRLLAAMAAMGFVNYPLEWWHYSRRDPDAPAVSFDVPIEPRPPLL